MPTPEIPYKPDGRGRLNRIQSADWIAIRQAFIDRPERPTIPALALEFGVTESRVARAAVDGGWAALRAARMDEALRSSDAMKALLDAARTEGTIQRSINALALELISQLHDVAVEAGRAKGKAENTRANTLNTVTFALRNLTGALKEIGVVGMAKALKAGVGMSDEQGRWNPQMLQSLNVTVQNIMATSPAAAPAPPPDAIPDVPAAAEGGEQAPALAEPAGVALEVPAVEREPVPADVI